MKLLLLVLSFAVIVNSVKIGNGHDSMHHVAQRKGLTKDELKARVYKNSKYEDKAAAADDKSCIIKCPDGFGCSGGKCKEIPTPEVVTTEAPTATEDTLLPSPTQSVVNLLSVIASQQALPSLPVNPSPVVNQTPAPIPSSGSSSSPYPVQKSGSEKFAEMTMTGIVLFLLGF